MPPIDRMAVTLTVNGEPQDLLIDARETLTAVLRDRLHLTGTKRGCNQGVCGACTVLIDGHAVRSCLALAADLEDSAIVTIEGLREDEAGRRVAAALVASAAVQCGFCTPGMVIGLTALFRDKGRPSREAVREALSGNLCRCTGYVKIIEAALALSEAGGYAG
jgi:aerobic carbon-monoxide dehydrogenase small subunit